MKHHPVRCAFALLSVLCTGGLAGAQEWTDDSFEDFAKGCLGEAGNNLYVSRDGSIRTINRFDFNQDGWIDLLFNSTHDIGGYVPATLGSIQRDGSAEQKELAVQGSKRIVVGDLNKDNYPDLVFLRSASGIQGGRSLLTIIWGGEDGWPASRAGGALPEPHVTNDIALADLDGDGWTDVVTFGGGGSPQSFIYWGGEHGMGTFRRSDLVASADTRSLGADFDGDGIADLAMAQPGKLSILWAKAGSRDLKSLERTDINVPGLYARGPLTARVNSGGRIDLIVPSGDDGVLLFPATGPRTWGGPVKLAVPATHASCGDLDADGIADLVLTSFSQIHAAGGEAGAAKAKEQALVVLWGDANGFSADRSTRLDAPFATSTAIGDLDADGQADLAVAIYQGDTHFAGESIVYLGQGNRAFTKSGSSFATQAPMDVAIIPSRSQGSLPHIVFCNSQGGTLGEKVPLDVYWGGADGFNEKQRWQIPFASGSESSAADLNADGYVDLVLTYSGHGGQVADTDPQVGTHILWGGRDGFSLERRTILREDKIWTTSVADLNRDGYLDIIACAESGIGGKPAHVFIYWGDATGFSTDRKQAIPVGKRATGGHAADLNNDGWLDIVSTDWFEHKVTILWGGEKGYAADRSSILEMDRALGVEVADLNRDGMLDLLISRYSDAAGENYDLGSFVFWGSARGYQQSNAQWLPGLTPDELVIADFDADGHLDVFSSHYHATSMRESIPSYLFWGGEDGLRADRKTRLVADSACGALAADFDRDGRLDLAIACHTVHGNHIAMSKVLYNDGKRFANPRFQELPTIGPHWMDMHDMGNIRDRSFRQTYESSTFCWERASTAGKIGFDADVPEGSALVMEVRAAPDEPGLSQQPWRAVENGAFGLKQNDRCLQYRAVFVSRNGDRYPVLAAVRVQLDP